MVCAMFSCFSLKSKLPNFHQNLRTSTDRVQWVKPVHNIKLHFNYWGCQNRGPQTSKGRGEHMDNHCNGLPYLIPHPLQIPLQNVNAASCQNCLALTLLFFPHNSSGQCLSHTGEALQSVGSAAHTLLGTSILPELQTRCMEGNTQHYIN